MADRRLALPIVVALNTEAIGLWGHSLNVQNGPMGRCAERDGTLGDWPPGDASLRQYHSKPVASAGETPPQKVHAGIVDHDALSLRWPTRRDKNAKDAHTKAAHVDC